jgi:translation initiation factor 3 subunit A
MDYRSILTRSALVSSINSMNLLGLVPAEVRAAYELLTSEFNPLELCKKLDPLLASLEVRFPLHFWRQSRTAAAICR